MLENMGKSEIIRGTSKCARFFVCDTTDIVKEAKKIHGLDPIATTVFGKLLTATAMMGKDLKNGKDLVTVKVNGDGPYGNMLATGNMKGEVKGYIGNPEDKFHQIIDENGNFIKDETGQVRFIGNGTMQVIKDLGMRDPFSGVTKINEEDIADIIAHYFLLSEQIKSVVVLGVKLDENGEIKRAGGYLIQLLPGVEDGFIDKLENKLQQIRTITELPVYKALKQGEEILNSLDEHAFRMNRLIKQVLSERHKYLGVLRFREMKDGTMFSTIEPKNNILLALISHFRNRMKKEKFAIFDKEREMIAYYDTEKVEIFFVKSPEIEWSDEEMEYSELWKTFHKSISIKERENKKLQQSNLPKYYWKYLVEDM